MRINGLTEWYILLTNELTPSRPRVLNQGTIRVINAITAMLGTRMLGRTFARNQDAHSERWAGSWGSVKKEGAGLGQLLKIFHLKDEAHDHIEDD